MGFNDFTKLGIVFVFVFFLAVYTFCSRNQHLFSVVFLDFKIESDKKNPEINMFLIKFGRILLVKQVGHRLTGGPRK